jgi:hypothetical protein
MSFFDLLRFIGFIVLLIFSLIFESPARACIYIVDFIGDNHPTSCKERSSATSGRKRRSSRPVGTIHTADKCPVKCCCENPIEWSQAAVEMRLEAPARAWRKVEVHASCMRVRLARVCSVPNCDFRRWSLRVLCRRGRVDSSVERRWKQGAAKQDGQQQQQGQQQVPCSWRCHQGANTTAWSKERYWHSCRPCQSSACCQSPLVCSPRCCCCRRLEQTTVRCPQSRGQKRGGRRLQ